MGFPDYKVAMYSSLDDACPTCRALDGWRIPYADLDDTPAMHTPHPNCTHPDGCRCVVMFLNQE
jgi:hypothetical protein